MAKKTKTGETRPPQPAKADHVAQSRALIRRARAAMLSTTHKSRGGWPYGSLVTVAFDCDMSPLMLFSTLSDHTRNLDSDPRGSLLFEETSRLKNPQTGPRVTVLGSIERTKNKRHQRRFLALHPEAARYAGFGDFGFFRMRIESAHYVGGFAKAIWLKGADIKPSAKAAAAIAKAEPDILEHMNADHADAVDHYANGLLCRSGKGWTMTGIDPNGFDLRRGGRTSRHEFETPVSDRMDVRQELVRLAGLGHRDRKGAKRRK
jgi:putative heme iron utilization protein